MFHPTLMIALGFFLIGVHANQSVAVALIDMALFVIGAIPALAYHYAARRQVRDHVQVRQYHRITMLLVVTGLALTFGALLLRAAPADELWRLAIIMLAIVGGIAVNRVTQMSFHASMSMIGAGALIGISWGVVALFAAVSIAVGLARLPLRQHTLGQVVLGWAYGFFTPSLFLLMLHYLLY
jgi:hypothetical protein